MMVILKVNSFRISRFRFCFIVCRSFHRIFSSKIGILVLNIRGNYGIVAEKKYWMGNYEIFNYMVISSAVPVGRDEVEKSNYDTIISPIRLWYREKIFRLSRIQWI
jgi:hypothetical protein